MTGWCGYGYNNTDNYFQTNIFFNPSYPGSGLYDGELLYNWKGVFDAVLPDYIYSFRQGISGMSGSPMFTKVGLSNVSYGILISSGIRFNRITPNKFDGINKIIEKNTPSEFDMIPLFTDVYPKILKKGNQLDSLNFVILNYSSASVSNANITANIYVSRDSIITTDDSLISTYNYAKSFTAKSSVMLNQKVNLPAIGKEAGTYWVGVIISGDDNLSNNTVSKYDASKIIINNTNNVRINGIITSSQSNNGISGVKLNGFPTSVMTDYKGFYETEVAAGWSGTVSASKSGFTISPPVTAYNDVNNGTVTNYSITKNTFTISGYAKSPIGQTGVRGVKLIGLANQPVTDALGYFSTTVFEGWSGCVNAGKQGWDFQNGYYSYSKINSNQTEQINAGFIVSGVVYKSTGAPIQNVKLDGYPGTAVYTDVTGQYTTFLDSGWVGTVTPRFSVMQFNPASRRYNGLATSYYYHDYQEVPAMTLNLKVILSGAYAKETDSMKSVLKQNSLLPSVPNTDYSNMNSKFVYKINQEDSVSASFWTGSMNIVDWISVEILNSQQIPVDTVICLLRNDGRVLSITGDTLIPLNPRVTAGQYYIIVRHRNHIAIMSAASVSIFENSNLYDFTTGLDKYYGNDAKMLKNGLYGMYAGDANFDGNINSEDLNFYETDSKNGVSGYRITDFNIDGYVSAFDFNLLAPNKRNLVNTKIPNLVASK